MSRSSRLDELRTLIDAAITRRLEAVTPEERARAGDDLLLIFGEFKRRGGRPYPSLDGAGDATLVLPQGWASGSMQELQVRQVT